MSTSRRIVVISDGTGETAVQMIRAAMVQFGDDDYHLTRYKNVRTEAQLEAIAEDAAQNRDLIVYTLVSPQLREFLSTLASRRGIPIVDLLGPLLLGLAGSFKAQPTLVAGLLHDVNERYFERIAAMEYTIKHDDGKDLTGLEHADLVILGISRTSKTPLSMYLSHQGWRVANIPIIPGFEIAPEIFAVDQSKVIGLTINSEELATIRRARLQRLGQQNGGDYADLQKVESEIEYAAEIYKKNRRWPIFNVTGKALEETAAEIIRVMTARRSTQRDKP